MTGRRGGGRWGIGGGLWLCSLEAPTPLLTSPLRGGRDELGKDAGVGLGAGFGEIPAASAGMTDLGVRV